jgi:hypothetical protein
MARSGQWHLGEIGDGNPPVQCCTNQSLAALLDVGRIGVAHMVRPREVLCLEIEAAAHPLQLASVRGWPWNEAAMSVLYS